MDDSPELDEIKARNRAVVKLRLAYLAKSEAAKEAKRAYNEAQDELSTFIDELSREFPLFDGDDGDDGSP